MRLFLVRHPPPAVAPGTCYGATDLPLADDPRHHAAALRPLLPPGIPIHSSPLMRCRLLAEALHPAPVFDDRLRELDFGDWEMQAWDSLDRRLLNAWAADPVNFVPPNGESVHLLMQRSRRFLYELAGDSIVLTHAGVIRALAGMINAVPANEWLQYSFHYGGMTALDWDKPTGA